MKKSATKRFGILTGGGDCPGLNAAIRGICKAANFKYNMEIIGIMEGYKGLVEGNGKLLKPQDFSGIINKGGTILGSSRERPFKNPNKIKAMIENYKKWNLDCIVTIGGNGTQKRANWLKQMGINVIGLPKTIDNDIFGTDMTFGFHSALDIATDAIDRLHTTANSHRRALVIEIMGNHAGWLTLYSGLAGGGDVIIIPEIPYDITIIHEHLKRRMEKKEGFSVIVVAEGAISIEEAKLSKKDLKKKRTEDGLSAAERLSKELNEISNFETRHTVLGYLQRGGSPSPYDRVLATQCGTAAAELLYRGDYNKMVVLKGNDITSVPIENIAEKTKFVPKNNIAIQSAKLSGTCFGDELTFL